MKCILFIIGMYLFLIPPVRGQQKTTTPKVYAELSEAVGNIAFDYQGGLVFSHHPFYNPKYKVVSYDANTKETRPFPNEGWNTPQIDTDRYLHSVLGIRNDSKGVVWMLDMGDGKGITPKFVGWNTKTNQLEKIYPVSAPASIPSSQLNDFVIDEMHRVFIIADEDIGLGGNGYKGALVVVDMKTGKARRLLEGHYSTAPDKTSPIVCDGQTLHIPNTQTPLLVGANGIVADKNNEWLYYAPLNGNKVYRIKMNHLLNESLSDKQLGKKVQSYADKKNNGGISIDTHDNLYLTYIENNSVAVIPARSKKAYVYVKNKKMIWPDGLSYNGADGYMYTGAAQIQLASVFNDGTDKTNQPFYIYRFNTLAKGISGR